MIEYDELRAKSIWQCELGYKNEVKHITNIKKRISTCSSRKELGLGTFLPTILLENVKRSEIRKHIRFYLKKDRMAGHQSACTPRVCSQSIGTEEPCEYIFLRVLIGDKVFFMKGNNLRIQIHLSFMNCIKLFT